MDLVKRKLCFAILIATLLWGIMFSPWSAPYMYFWPTMTISAIILCGMAFYFRGDWLDYLQFTPRMIIYGICLAFFLWMVFWLGDKASTFLFSFAPKQICNVYTLKEGTSPGIIGFLLLIIIGPAEEIFWRGYVQRTFSELYGVNQGAIYAVISYTMIHIFSLNFMLLAAAGVLGVIWSTIFRFRPNVLPALIVSHAIWDVTAFVIFPFR